MTTSGGGMLLTDDEDLAAHVRKLSTQAREPVPHYEHAEVGYNYRLSNLLAALGRAQLTPPRRHDRPTPRRGGSATARCSPMPPGSRSWAGATTREDNCWLTAITVDPERRSAGRRPTLAAVLADAGIESRPVWKPMHLQPVFARMRLATVTGAAERLFERGLTLPSGSVMTDAQLIASSRLSSAR